jgi:hypothetical protein
MRFLSKHQINLTVQQLQSCRFHFQFALILVILSRLIPFFVRSVDQLLSFRVRDPEELLCSLGFGSLNNTEDNFGRIPPRFFQYSSQASGMTLTDVLERNPELKEYLLSAGTVTSDPVTGQLLAMRSSHSTALASLDDLLQYLVQAEVPERFYSSCHLLFPHCNTNCSNHNQFNDSNNNTNTLNEEGFDSTQYYFMDGEMESVVCEVEEEPLTQGSDGSVLNAGDTIDFYFYDDERIRTSSLEFFADPDESAV